MMEAYREEAQRLLEEILNLAKKRREVAEKIGREKAKRGLPVEDPERELRLRPKLDRNLGALFNLLIWDSLLVQGYEPMPKGVRDRGLVDLSSDDPDLFLPSRLDISSRKRLEDALSERFGMDVKRAYAIPDRYTALLLILWSECRGSSISLPKPSPRLYGFLAWIAGVRPYFGFEAGPRLAGAPHNPSGRHNPEIADCTYYDFSPTHVSAKIIIYSPGAIFGLTSPSIVFGEVEEELEMLLTSFEGRSSRLLAEAILSMERPRWDEISGEIIESLEELGLRPIDYNGGPFVLLRKAGAHELLRKAGVLTAPGELFGLSDEFFRITIASKGIFEGLELIRDAFSRSSP